MAVFHNMLDVSAYNAWVLWKAVNPIWNQRRLYKRRLFLEALGRALVTPMIEGRQRLPREPAAMALVMSARAPLPAVPEGPPNRPPSNPARSKCMVCRRGRSSVICSGCKKRVCPKCYKKKNVCNICVTHTPTLTQLFAQ